MSVKHPVIAITGSSGAGTSTVKKAFEHIFKRVEVKPAVIEGDSFHSLNRVSFKMAVARAEKMGNGNFSHFGPDSNHFDALEDLFRTYGEKGMGRRRYYLHNDKEAKTHSKRLGLSQRLGSGEFTPWEDLEPKTDLLFYEGLHGLVKGKHQVKGKTQEYDVAQHVDLGIGVVPVVNLEWIQKIHRDGVERGYDKEVIVDTILRRMPDYVNHITPQFSRTHVNFQRVATVDTSNPFIARDIPTLDESFVVIRFKDLARFDTDYYALQSMIQGSFMSRPNTLVVPGGKMGFAMEIIFRPTIEAMMQRRREVMG